MRIYQVRTVDRASFYTTEQLGRTRRLTPEGFLVCEAVPIARIGQQLYHQSELGGGLRGDSDGIVVVQRTPDEVFRPATLASFEGKPVTIDHPSEFVTPRSCAELAVGHAQHVRRGLGAESDLLLADLIITDPEAIAYVNRALPQVSAGYSADYDQKGPGEAEQRNIVGNHIALVERGRAGPRVAIRDCLTSTGAHMKTHDYLMLMPKPVKLLKNGVVYEGGLTPRIDNETEPTAWVVVNEKGEVLAEFTAEEYQGNIPARLVLGTAYTGDAKPRMRTPAGIETFGERARAAHDQAMAAFRAGVARAWGRPTAPPTSDAARVVGGRSATNTIEDVNRRNREFWAKHNGRTPPDAA